MPHRLRPPADVCELAETLERAGFQTWCVGGAVRDALLGLPHLDWDLATAATPPEVRRIFRRTVPVGEQFGTIGVFGRSGRMHEVTTFRRDVRTDGRHAEVEFGASLDEDLARRDFTINAIAFSPTRNELHDPFGGQRDLARKCVRAVGTACERMREDRLRALRGLRFAGRFGFEIERETWNAIVESASALDRLSKERVQQELVKTMDQVARPSAALDLWARSGALAHLLPALSALPRHYLHAADFVDSPERARHEGRARRRTLLRIASLVAGCEERQVGALLRGLRFSNRDVALIAERVSGAQAIGAGLMAAVRGEGASEAVLRRWAARCGRTALADVMRVAFAVWQGEHDAFTPAVARRAHSIYRSAVRVAYRDPIAIADLAVDGEDLMREAKVAGGRALGETLRLLVDWVVDDPARNTRDQLLAHARSLGGGETV